MPFMADKLTKIVILVVRIRVIIYLLKIKKTRVFTKYGKKGNLAVQNQIQ